MRMHEVLSLRSTMTGDRSGTCTAKYDVGADWLGCKPVRSLAMSSELTSLSGTSVPVIGAGSAVDSVAGGTVDDWPLPTRVGSDFETETIAHAMNTMMSAAATAR